MITQRKSVPKGHPAGKARQSSRHDVLAFDKSTYAQEIGTVSGEHRVHDETLQDRFDAPHLDGLLTGTDEDFARVFGSMSLDDIGYGAQRLPLPPGLVEAPLQESEHQMEHGVPFLDGFVGLHSEVPQSQRLFEVPVVDFQGPAVAIPVQRCLWDQSQVGTQKALRVLVPIVPSGDEYADIERNVVQTPLHRTHQVSTGGAVCSGNLYTGIPLVLQLLIPLVDSDTIQRSIAFEDTNNTVRIWST
jgi:hypothetical protein